MQWVEHHRALGVGRIYVFDHGSDAPLDGTLRDLIASGYVRYEYTEMSFVDADTKGAASHSVFCSIHPGTDPAPGCTRLPYSHCQCWCALHRRLPWRCCQGPCSVRA